MIDVDYFTVSLGKTLNSNFLMRTLCCVKEQVSIYDCIFQRKNEKTGLHSFVSISKVGLGITIALCFMSAMSHKRGQ